VKFVVGIVLILGGIALGLYLGLWVCFIGGIIQIVEQVKLIGSSPETIQGAAIVWGVVKIFFASVVGVFSRR